MAARVFQIIGIVALALLIPVSLVLLYMAGKMLKKVNRSLAGRAADLRKQVVATFGGVDTAQEQIAAFSMVSSSVKAGLDQAIDAAGKAVGFLKSTAFQVGLPTAIWVLFFAVTLPRGLAGLRKKKESKVKPIPPPSWEKEQG